MYLRFRGSDFDLFCDFIFDYGNVPTEWQLKIFLILNHNEFATWLTQCWMNRTYNKRQCVRDHHDQYIAFLNLKKLLQWLFTCSPYLKCFVLCLSFTLRLKCDLIIYWSKYNVADTWFWIGSKVINFKRGNETETKSKTQRYETGRNK